MTSDVSTGGAPPDDERIDRVLALKAAAEKIAQPESDAGKRAREWIREESGLSPQGVHYALCHCLEFDVARSTLTGMIRKQDRRARSFVLLSANVFVASFRAIALGMFQSPKTYVRASRRAQALPALLHEYSGEAFSLVDELSPLPGDPVWAYGNDETLSQLRESLPPGVEFHPHGAGLGAAVFRERGSGSATDLERAVDGLAADTCVFDQRGCLSPRFVLIEGSRSFAETVCDLLVVALDRWEKKMPRGKLSEQEQADALRHEATMMYVGSCVVAGMGLVSLDAIDERVLVPPVGRYLHVTVCQDACSLLGELASQLTTVGIYNADQLPGRLREAVGDRRYVDLGQMQRPRFDGPVDLRQGDSFEVL